MKKLRIGFKIKELRKNRGLTQERLAELIGVSSAAVSKWESEKTFPDITLLPKLAELFSVTIDELMGVDGKLSREEGDSIYKECERMLSSVDIKKGYQLCEEKIHKHKNDFYLKYKLSSLYIFYCWKLEEEEAVKKIKRGEELLEEVIENCREKDILHMAKFSLASRKTANGDYERAEKLLQSIDNYNIDVQSLLGPMYIMKGDFNKGREIIQRKIFNNIWESFIHIKGAASSYSNEYLSTGESREGAAKKIQYYYDLLFKLMDLFKDSFGRKIFSKAGEYISLSLELLKLGEREEAVKQFTLALEEMRTVGVNDPIDVSKVECFKNMGEIGLKYSVNLYENYHFLIDQDIFNDVKNTGEYEALKKYIEKNRKNLKKSEPYRKSGVVNNERSTK